jgi:anti-sigma factor RsiW
MNCETARHLTETNDPGLEQHLRSCPSCIVRTHARYYEAPPDLEARIRQSLRRESAPSSPWRWMAIAASLLLAVSLTWNLAQLRSRVDPRQALAASVLSAHIRSLGEAHLLDVRSSDRHTVKPWFNGKLDFSPPVKFLDDFPLLGGRLEYLYGHSAAALVYGRDKHIINLFIWPSAMPAVPADEAKNGYNMTTWAENGMTFWAVSDLNDAELRRFVSLYRHN